MPTSTYLSWNQELRSPAARRVLALLAAFGPCIAVAAEAAPDGAAIYAARCVQCHASDGAGSSDGPRPFEGDRSVAQLAEIIAETMPEDDPGSLSADEARAVAAYLYDGFYSPIAQARRRSPRIELARLTVGQYRRAVADLLGGGDGGDVRTNEHGLQGAYFQDRKPSRRAEAALTRVDAGVDFDFGVESPAPEIAEPHGFSIRWKGSLRAAETGEYEFVVRTNHAARLWVNDEERPLIDAWVKSGDANEYAARLFLAGGRAYPLRLEFSKAKLGVDDSDQQKELPPSQPAAIALLCRRPHGALQTIPAHVLSTGAAGQSFVCATPFPPDDRSYGWERGTSVSKEWDAATTAAAIEAADYVASRLESLTGAGQDDEQRREKLTAWARSFVERAFRSPLSDDVAARYIDAQLAEAAPQELDAALRRVVLMTLKSPRFLFRELPDAPPTYATAARLSFGLWDSLPDKPLVEAAASGALATADGLQAEAERMAADPRAHAKLHEFLLAWLDLDVPAELRKDPAKYPDCDEQFFADLRTSLELFLDEVLDSPEADYRRLLLADEVYVNRRLAGAYGVEAPSADGFAKVQLDDGRRAGILTHPYMMARFSYSSETSPIHRGVFLARGMLGQTLRPPPEAFAPIAADLHPQLTTRERVSLQTEPAACMTCHRIINPLGFTLERFDAIGRYREHDRDKPVNDVGAFQTSAGDAIPLHGARDLAQYVAASQDGQAAFVEQMFHHLVQQPVEAYGPAMLDRLRESFVENQYNIRRLAVEIMVATAPVGRETDE